MLGNRIRLPRVVVGAVVLLVGAAGLAVAAPQRAQAAPSCPSLCPVLAWDDEYTTTYVPSGPSTFTVDAPGVLDNDQGPSDSRVWVSETDTESYWGNATVKVVASGKFTYKPDPETPFTGIDEFEYTIRNNKGEDSDDFDYDWATAYITIVPILTNDTYNVVGGTLTVPAATGVLANDKGVDPASIWVDELSAQGGTIDDDGDGAFTYTAPAGFSGTDTFTYEVDDLNADNSYDATVTVNVAQSATLPTPPAAPVAKPGNKQATLTWSGADGGGNPIVAYEVTAAPGGKTKTVDGSKSTVTFTGLANGTAYKFTIRTLTAAGSSAPSAASKAVTPRTIPGKPTSVRGTASGTSATVTWAAPPTNGAAITGATVLAKGPVNRTVTVTGSGRSAKFTGLAAGKYTFSVKSKNAAGYGAYSTASPKVSVPKYTAKYTEAEYQMLVKTARHFHLAVADVGPAGVKSLRFILALSGDPAPRPAARPQNTGPRVLSATFTAAENSSTLAPVSRYLALNGNDTLKVGSALLQYIALLQGVR